MEQRYLADYVAGVGGPPGLGGEKPAAELLRDVQDYLGQHQQAS